MAKDKALRGAAGEHYVAFRLSAMGYAVGLTTRGTRLIDIVVANPNTGKSITIQTKTMLEALVRSKKWGPYWEWRVGTSRKPHLESFFYAFVDLKNNPTQTPDIFIVPSAQLPSLLERFPESETEPAKDIWCVIYEEDAPKYLENWDVMKDALE